MRRRTAVLTAVGALVVLALVSAVLLLGRDDEPAAAPGPPPATSSSPEPESESEPETADGGYAWYLALGDSLAAGYQPTNPGDRTDPDGGYAGAVRDGLAVQQTEPPALTNLGCPGETTATFADGGVCDYPEGTQLAAALAFLEQAEGDGLVTVQLGANDVQSCVVLSGAPTVDEACVAAGLEAARTRLPESLAELRADAPDARVVVLDYYNPFAAASLFGERGEQLALRSAEVQVQLNADVAASAAGVGADVAPVAQAFAPAGDAVGQLCTWTWICGALPDVHATDAGYAVMADQVLAALGVPASGAG